MCKTYVSKDKKKRLVVVAEQEGKQTKKAIVPHFCLDAKIGVSRIRTWPIFRLIANLLGLEISHPAVQEIFINNVEPEIKLLFG